MKRNIFGEPIPSNLDEIDEAMMEADMIMEECSIIIDFETDVGDFQGFSAVITDHSQDRSFTTMGYESKDKLTADLRSIGFTWSQIGR